MRVEAAHFNGRELGRILPQAGPRLYPALICLTNKIFLAANTRLTETRTVEEVSRPSGGRG
jgi:hypothetical protein